MEPEIGSDERHPVACTDRLNPGEQEVDRSAADQEGACAARGLCQGESGDAEETVDDVVQDTDLEQAEHLGGAVVSGELEAVVQVRGYSGDEPGDADEQEDDSHESSHVLDGRPIHCNLHVDWPSRDSLRPGGFLLVRRLGGHGSLDTPRRCQYVDEMGDENRKKSLHDVLRERRAAKPLLSVKELQAREAERRRDEVEALASERVERWRQQQKPVDAEGKLAPSVYRAVFARSRPAYLGSRHWSRRARAQLELTSLCEVERCGRAVDLRASQLGQDAIGEEQAGRDLITLCEGCLGRALKREEELGRPCTRDELRALDPQRPLYDRAAIAALKAKHRRPLRRSDLEQRR